MTTLKPFNQIGMPNLVNNDMDSLMSDVIAKIKSDPDWDAIYDGDLWQNSFQSILQLFAYLFERNHDSNNMILKEKFLNQAFSEQAIYDDLSDMRINLEQARAAAVSLNGAIVNDLLLEPLMIPKYYQLTGTNANNESIVFEIIKKDYLTNKYNYFENTIVYPAVASTDHIEVTAYAGTTFSEEYVIDQTMYENFIINVEYGDIEEDSIQVFYITGAGIPIELPYTDSFTVAPDIEPTYFPSGKPYWTLKWNADGSAKILFGNALFGGAFDSTHLGNKITVYGRYDVGAKTNVLAGGINYTATFLLSTTRTLTIQFTNDEDASGGVDKEDIFDAQVFAPYRYGRGKPIIDKADAKNKLLYLLIKHEIETPQYNEVDRTVPLLHAFHYCVPIRDFTLFIVPDATTSDTAATYSTKFITALNEFCNVVGMHDLPVTNEEAATFVYPDVNGNTILEYEPAQKYPLSASLNAVAYDYADRIVDSITWRTNYVSDYRLYGVSYSSAPAEHAYVETNAFSLLTVVNNFSGRNDRLIFSFDEDVYPYTFDIQLTPGIKTYDMYASELLTLIQAAIAADAAEMFAAVKDFEFVVAEPVIGTTTGKVKLVSPSTGRNSKVTIKDNYASTSTDPQYNIYLYFGWQQKIYRPVNESGLVFELSNTYKYEINTIGFIFRNDRYSVLKTKTYAEAGVVIDHAVTDGPLLTILLTGENTDQLERLFEDEDLTVAAYNEAYQVDNIVAVADVSGSLNNKFFWFFTESTSYYVWYNVNAGGADPSPAVPSGAPAGSVGIEVDIATNDVATTVALATRTKLITLVLDKTITGSIDEIIITHNAASDIKNTQDAVLVGDRTLFTFSTSTEGVAIHPVDYMIFPNITSLSDNQGIPGDGTEFLPETYTPGDVFKSSTQNKYIYDTAKAYLLLKDNVLITVYYQTYPTIYRIDLVRIYEDPLNPGFYLEDSGFTPIEFLEYNGNYTHDVLESDGKTVTLTLTAGQNNSLVVGDDFMLKFYHKDSGGIMHLVETAKMLNISVNITAFSDMPLVEVCIDQVFSSNQYDKAAMQITFKLLDGTLDPSVIYYDQDFADFTELRFTYKHKTYDTVELNYTPNPYYPENEAASIVSVLSNKANRLVGLEHLIKAISFEPRPLTLQLTIKKNYSLSNAIDAVNSLLYEYFGYDNTNSNHSIGGALTFQIIKNAINLIANEYGIMKIDISGTDDIVPIVFDNSYKFFLDSGVYDQLRAKELEYTNITGISNLYKMNITAVLEAMII